MDGWGSLTMLLKRQNADKYRKAQLRHELQKKRESFLSNQKVDSGLDLPELTRDQMERIKQEIRSNLRKQQINSRLISILIFILVVILVGSLFLFYMGEMETRQYW